MGCCFACNCALAACLLAPDCLLAAMLDAMPPTTAPATTPQGISRTPLHDFVANRQHFHRGIGTFAGRQLDVLARTGAGMELHRTNGCEIHVEGRDFLRVINRSLVHFCYLRTHTINVMR